MKYLSITVNNFKGIRELTLKLKDTEKVITLVGLNESGKTTILEAINSFTYGAEELPFETSGFAKPDLHDLIPVSQRANFNGITSVTMEVQVTSDDKSTLTAHLKKEHQYKLTSVSEQIKITDQYTF